MLGMDRNKDLMDEFALGDTLKIFEIAQQPLSSFIIEKANHLNP